MANIKNTDAQTAIEAPVGMDSMKEKKYPSVADRVPIIVEKRNTSFKFSVK